MVNELSALSTPSPLAGLGRTIVPATTEDPWQRVYRQLHAHPELSGREFATASLVAEQLRALPGWEVTERVGGTGVVGVLRGGPGPVVWMRADMDALPVHEDTGLDYASTVSGVMHACGHDIHVAALLGVCAELAAGDTVTGTVVAIFQPAEETGAGAAGMLNDGLLERFPRPDICLGQHVGPTPAGLVLTRSDTLMAASDSVRVRLAGIGGHGSSPHLAVNPLTMAASLVLRLDGLVARQAAVGSSPVLTAGSLHVGTRPNIIAENAELLLTLRTFSERSRAQMMEAIRRVVAAEAAAAGTAIAPEVEFYDHFPMTVNTVGATERVMAELGATGLAVLPLRNPLSGSEDFGLLGTAAGCPSVFWNIGGFGPDRFGPDDAAYMLAEGTVPPHFPVNHSSRFAPDPAVTLPAAIAAMGAAVRAELGIGECCAAVK
ncbi:amidohydrolase [Nocardia sp. NPDC087230]|uniref:amidohydrolase n=1 Tax=unclassified Nocardia TaxID=2637762 RepID=UPI00319E6F94